MPHDQCTYMTRSFDPGEILFVEEELGDSAFLIKSGAVKIAKRGSDGDMKTIATYGPGDIIGEMALIDGVHRSATAVATEDTEAIVVGSDDLRDRMAKSDEVIQRVIRSLTKRLRVQADLIAELSSKPMKQVEWHTPRSITAD